MYKNFVSRQEIHLVRQYALALIHITFCMPGFVSWKRPQQCFSFFLVQRVLLGFRWGTFFLELWKAQPSCFQGNKHQEALLVIKTNKIAQISLQTSCTPWLVNPTPSFPELLHFELQESESKEANPFSKSHRAVKLKRNLSILVLFHYLLLPPFQISLKSNWRNSGKLHKNLLHSEITPLHWE